MDARELLDHYMGDDSCPLNGCALREYKIMSITKRKKILDKMPISKIENLALSHITCERRKKESNNETN